MSIIEREPAFAASFRAFADGSAGLTERFLQPTLGGRRTIAVLSEPFPHRDTPSIGWVVCHSFGMEQMYLHPLEVATARRLACDGAAVLRFHGGGYGDNEADPEHTGLRAYVVDVIEAVRMVRSETGVEHVGLLGARFGGTVAAMVAERIDVSALSLWDPVVDGGRYMRALVRGLMAEELAGGARDGDAPEDPVDVLERAGILEIQGYFPLRRHLYNAISKAKLLPSMGRYAGRSLVVQVSRTSSPRPELRQVVERTAAAGGRSRLEVVAHPQAALFGQQRYRSTGSASKRDTQQELSTRILSVTAAWCADVAASFRHTATGRPA